MLPLSFRHFAAISLRLFSLIRHYADFALTPFHVDVFASFSASMPRHFAIIFDADFDYFAVSLFSFSISLLPFDAAAAIFAIFFHYDAIFAILRDAERRHAAGAIDPFSPPDTLITLPPFRHADAIIDFFRRRDACRLP
jgi:hypothetical protein